MNLRFFMKQLFLLLFGRFSRIMYERPVRERLLRMRGETFIDIGASVGYYTVMLSRHFSHVIAVEPNPDAILKLKRNLVRSGVKNVTLFPVAVSDEDGEVTLYLDHTFGRLDGSADTIEPLFEYKPVSKPNVNLSYRGRASARVKTQRLDTLLRDCRDEVDLVKVDVEGAEFRVLKGAEQSIRKIRTLVIELHDRDRRRELETMLSRYDFDLEWVDKDHLFATSKLSKS
jgi:FkbM family methyltransferase